MKQYTRRPSFLLAAIMVALMVVVGCGNLDQSLVNSSHEVSVEDALQAPAGYIAFSPRAAMQVATKKVKVNNNNTMVHFDNPTGLQTQMVEYEFDYNRNKRISIKFKDLVDGDADVIQVKQAQFSVEKNSINTEGLTESQLERYGTRKGINIRMQVVTGTKLEDIVVAFGPGGLQFDPVAQLRLQLIGDLTNVFEEGENVAYHIDGEGVVTKVSLEVDELDGSSCVLNIDVPGFSRYTIDD